MVLQVYYIYKFSKMKYINLIFIFLFTLNIPLMLALSNSSAMNFYLQEVRSLSELPIEKLIRLKSSFVRTAPHDYNSGLEGRSSLSMPLLMPVKRTNNYPIRRYEEWDDYEKDSKISKIFQLTVSALSFLAFGGYLLTLIITAIRRNQANNGNQGNVVVLSAAQRIKRPKRGLFVYDPAENDYDIENLYKGMLMLSSDYSRPYH